MALRGYDDEEDILDPRRGGPVGNGSRLLPRQVDGRTIAARRFRDVLRELTDEFTGERGEVASPSQSQLLRRASSLSIACEEMEAKAADGEVIDHDVYAKLTAGLLRTFRALGLAHESITPRRSTLNGPVATAVSAADDDDGDIYSYLNSIGKTLEGVDDPPPKFTEAEEREFAELLQNDPTPRHRRRPPPRERSGGSQ